MSRFVKVFDQFGVPMTQQIDKDEPQFKSVLGGFVTIIIYLASLFYCIYVGILWMQGEFSPKVSTFFTVKDYGTEKLNIDLISFEYWKYDDVLIDPFKAQGNILTPVLYTSFIDGTNSTENILNQDVQDISMNGAQIIRPLFGIQYNQSETTGDTYLSTDMQFLIVLCVPELMKAGQYCATDEEIYTFFHQSQNNIMLQMTFTKLNPLTQEPEQWVDDVYLAIEDQSCIQLALKLVKLNYEVKKSLLPGNSDSYSFWENSGHLGQTTSLQFCKRAYNGLDTIFAMYLQVESQQKNVSLEYPNLGDILANIGSIVSIFFMAKYIIIAFNSYFLQERIINRLCDYYYPEFQKIIVHKNWKQQITSVTFNNKSIDIPSYQKFERQLRIKMRNQISLSNMIYVISRLELIVRSLVSLENLKRSHTVGIKVKLKAQEMNSDDCEIFSQRETPNNLLLTDEDCCVLSLDHRQLYLIVNEETDPNYDYYRMNQIAI